MATICVYGYSTLEDREQRRDEARKFIGCFSTLPQLVDAVNKCPNSVYLSYVDGTGTVLNDLSEAKKRLGGIWNPMYQDHVLPAQADTMGGWNEWSCSDAKG